VPLSCLCDATTDVRIAHSENASYRVAPRPGSPARRRPADCRASRSASLPASERCSPRSVRRVRTSFGPDMSFGSAEQPRCLRRDGIATAIRAVLTFHALQHSTNRAAIEPRPHLPLELVAGVKPALKSNATATSGRSMPGRRHVKPIGHDRSDPTTTSSTETAHSNYIAIPTSSCIRRRSAMI